MLDNELGMKKLMLGLLLIGICLSTIAADVRVCPPWNVTVVDEKGQPGVYVLEGASAKWKPITILHDNGESYVVKLDKTSTDNLWPGDEVIVNAKNLYDGKVVE